MNVVGPFERVYSLEDIILNDWPAFDDLDLALLRTTEPIQFNEGAQPVCPPPAPYGGVNEYVGDDSYTIGWGDIFMGWYIGKLDSDIDL